MEDHSPTQSFSNLQNHRHHSSFPLTVHSFQSSGPRYLSSQPAQDSQEQYGCREQESTAPFLTSNFSGQRRTSSLDGDATLGGYFGGENRLGCNFDELWYSRKGMWNDRESGENAADDFHSKGDCFSDTNDGFCTTNGAAEEGDRWRIRSNYNSYVSCEAKSDYNREANMTHFNKQTVSYNRGGTDSKVNEQYLGGGEESGSSCGSAEDQPQPADAEGSWLSASPTGEAEVRGQAEGRWRGAADFHSLSSGSVSQRSPVGINSRMYTQKLDSFSEAFLSQGRRSFLMTPSGNSSEQIWENGVGRGETAELIKSRQSCAFDSDPYLPPSSSSSSSTRQSLPPFPSPPTSSHLMSSVLSPPPTPLPPPSHSPSKTESPSAQGGTGHSVIQGGESAGALQFFPPRIQALPSVHSSGMIWKFPLLSHCFPQQTADPRDTEGNTRAYQSHDSDSVTASSNILQSPESSSLTSSSHHSSLLSSRAPCPPSSPSLPFPLPFHPSHFTGKHHETTEKMNPYKVTQKIKNEAASLNQPHVQPQATPVFTGKPFPSILLSKRAQNRGRYTPRPLLNPARRGTGLYSSLSSLYHGELETACSEAEECSGLPHVNVGPDFQADLPPCFVDQWSRSWFPEEDSPRETLLWTPWDELQESPHIQGQVEKLLSMCRSSCLPGGGSNTELALYCLHHCQGNTMATLEMLLFSQPSPTGNYHYSGCDFWTETEKSLFSAAFGIHGKDFSLIKTMVKTKTVSQCVEFYYLSKKLMDKQKKQKEDECRNAEEELKKCMIPFSQSLERPFSLEEVVPVPSLASFFPCKLCGKMFYKIKSRNAHMKIHRQPQEDWTDRRLQHQLLTQRLALSRNNNLIPSPGNSLLPPQASALTFSSCGLTSSTNSIALDSVTNSNAIVPNDISILDTAVTYSNIVPQNSPLIPISNTDVDDSNRKDPTAVLPFHQPWGSFGLPQDLATFYCLSDGKNDVGVGTVGGKETTSWQ